jgi:hypothetical protein
MQVGNSSLVNSPFASDPLGALGQVGKSDSAKPASPAEVAAQKAEEARANQRATLDAIREKGIYAWAQEQKLEKLREKIEAQVKAELGDDADPVVIEGEIAKRVKEAMETSLKAEAAGSSERNEPAKPMIIDISV